MHFGFEKKNTKKLFISLNNGASKEKEILR